MKDIVEVLRARHANVTGNDPRITQPIVGPTVFLEAADEIERLRNELDGAQLAYRGACYDRDLIKSERDAARREVCNNEANHLPTMADPYMEAKRRGWDCFKETDE